MWGLKPGKFPSAAETHHRTVLGPIVAHHIPNLNDLRWICQTQGATHKPRGVSLLKTLRCLIPSKRVIYPTMGNSKGKSTCHSKGKPVEKWSNEGIFHTITFHSWPQLGDWRCIPTVKFFLRKKIRMTPGFKREGLRIFTPNSKWRYIGDIYIYKLNICRSVQITMIPKPEVFEQFGWDSLTSYSNSSLVAK